MRAQSLPQRDLVYGGIQEMKDKRSVWLVCSFISSRTARLCVDIFESRRAAALDCNCSLSSLCTLAVTLMIGSCCSKRQFFQSEGRLSDMIALCWFSLERADGPFFCHWSLIRSRTCVCIAKLVLCHFGSNWLAASYDWSFKVILGDSLSTVVWQP